MAEMEKKLLKVLERLSETLPKFPDGRIDYSSSEIAPVITIFVRYGSKILLLRRSDRVSTYRGKWNTVAGYLDELKPLKEKILEELREEIGIDEKLISSIEVGEFFEFKDREIGRRWIVTPALVELIEKPNIKLNWEHSEYRWIEPNEMDRFDTVPNLDTGLKRILQGKN
jgi:ADP-ribose pyrophosphatase YjhB (NUDIX family)